MFRGTVIYDRGMKAAGAQEFQVLLVMTHRLMCIAHCWYFLISTPIWSQLFFYDDWSFEEGYFNIRSWDVGFLATLLSEIEGF